MIKNKLLIIILSFIIALFCEFLMLKSYIYIGGAIVLIILAVLALKSPLFFLISVIVIFEEGFQTIDFGIPHWMYKDIAVTVLGIGLIAQFFRNGFCLHIGKENSYFRYILLLFLIVFLSILIGSWWIYEQPVNSLIFRGRPFYLYLIFLYLTMVNFNCEQIKKFIKFVVFSALIVSILVIIDAKVLGGGKIFHLAMSNGISGFRGGSVRIWTYSFITIWAYFYLLSGARFKKEKIKKALYIIFFLIINYQIIFCNTTRQLIAMLFLTTILFFFNLKAFSKIMIACITVIIITSAIAGYVSNSDLFKNIFFYKIAQETRYEAKQTTKGNIAIRANAIRYFYPYFKKTGFLGMGMMSYTNKDSLVSIGFEKGYSFWDLGFFAMLFRFGIFAIIFIFFVLKRIFKDLRFIQAKVNDPEMQIVANSLIYMFISKIILLPSSTIFFGESDCLYYGILFYFIYRMKVSAVKEATKIIPAENSILA